MSESKQVALPVSVFFPKAGGAQIAVHNMASRLKKRGWNPVVIAPYSCVNYLKRKKVTFDYEILPHLPKMGTIVKSKLMTNINNLYFENLQTKYKFKLWHTTCGYPAGVAVQKFLNHRKIPHLIQCVGVDIQVDKSTNYGFRMDSDIDHLVREYLPKASKLLAISESVVEEYKKLGIDDEKITLLSRGVDNQIFQNNSDKNIVLKNYNIDPDKFIYLSVGRYHKKKNFEGIIRAFSSFSGNDLRSSHLVIAGKQLHALNGLINELGLKESISLIEMDNDIFVSGRIENLPSRKVVELYQSADVFVFPSFIETFGIVQIEAMAAGLPVITSNRPGCINVAGAGKYAVVVDPDDRNELFREMIEMQRCDVKRKKFSELSRLRAEEHSWERITDDLVKIYNTIL